MSIPMALLAMLDDGPSHGFALKHRYDSLLGQGRELKYGQVYATLARLDRDGLAREVGVEPGVGADRRLYAITPAGVTELDAWLATPYDGAQRPSELFTKTILALVAGRDPALVLDAQRRLYLERARELAAHRREGDQISRLAADYEIAHLEADLGWIELAAARLTALRDAAAPVRSPDRTAEKSNEERGE